MSNKAIKNVSLIKVPHVNQKYSVILLAAGSGNRMTTFGARSLAPIGDNLLIDEQVKHIHSVFPVVEIILVTGFESDKVMNHAPKEVIKVENEGYADTNIARSIGLGLRAATTDRIITIQGDLAFNKTALNLPFDRESCIVANTSEHLKENEIGFTSGKTYVEQMFYGLPNKWAQIAYFTGKEADLLRQITWKKENAHLFSFEIVNKIIDKGGKFRVYSPDPSMFAFDIDCSKDYAFVRKVFKSEHHS
jgi:choline kinase